MKTIIRGMGIAAVLLLAACSTKPTPTGSTPGQPAATAVVYAPPIEIVKPDGTSVIMEYKTIAGLPAQLLVIGGKNETGPTVPDVLAAAEVKDFTSVTLFGLENKSISFNHDELNDQIILAFREHAHAVNLESPNIPVDQWVLHVYRIEVK